MRRIWLGLQLLIAVSVCLVASGAAFAQVPSSIQIFMPNGGGTPSRTIRLTLARDDGFIDTVFTDSKGKYQIDTPRNGAAFYTVTIETDNQTYATTTATFRLYPGTPNETAIFLRPLEAQKLPANAVVDATNFEGTVPAKARDAYKRGMEFLSAGNLESAIGSLQDAIDLYPKYVRALNDLGVIFLKQNRLDEAAARFRTAVEISKRFFHARLNLGLVLNRQGKYREALAVLEPLDDEEHWVPEVRLAHATALKGAEEFPEAEKVYRSMLSSKNLPPQIRAEAEFGLGTVLNRQGRSADAGYHLEEAIKLGEDNFNSHLQLGGALMQLQEFERAETELLRAYELGGKLAGGAQLLLGHLYYGQRKFEDAKRAFEQYLRDMPSAPNASEITKLIAELKAAPRN
jgi:tetratricopeptide (TPR) repeat protein